MYSASQKAAAAAALRKQMPGLDPAFLAVWINAEQGNCNNILGVTSANNCSSYSGGHQGCGTVHRLCSFDNFDAAARATRSLIYGSGYYTGLASAISSGDGRKQAQALINSPWAGNKWWYWDKFHHAAQAGQSQFAGLKEPNQARPGKPKVPAGQGGRGGGGKPPITDSPDRGPDPNFQISDCATPPSADSNGVYSFPFLKQQCIIAILNSPGYRPMGETGTIGADHVLTKGDMERLSTWASVNVPDGPWYQFLVNNMGSDGSPFTGKRIGSIGFSDPTIPGATATSGHDPLDPLGGLGDIGNQITHGIFFLAILFVAIALIIAAALIVKQGGNDGGAG